MFKGNIFIYLPFTKVYQRLCRLLIKGKLLLQNQYCEGLSLGKGVGGEREQIGAKIVNFKYWT